MWLARYVGPKGPRKVSPRLTRVYPGKLCFIASCPHKALPSSALLEKHPIRRVGGAEGAEKSFCATTHPQKTRVRHSKGVRSLKTFTVRRCSRDIGSTIGSRHRLHCHCLVHGLIFDSVIFELISGIELAPRLIHNRPGWWLRECLGQVRYVAAARRPEKGDGGKSRVAATRLQRAPRIAFSHH